MGYVGNSENHPQTPQIALPCAKVEPGELLGEAIRPSEPELARVLRAALDTKNTAAPSSLEPLMSARHRLRDFDALTSTATCAICGAGARVILKPRINRWGGGRIAEKKCYSFYLETQRRHRKRTRRPYRSALREICERCGFVPEDRCQLDVHHLDGNHSNHSPENLKTICANCHRLAHKQNTAPTP